MSMDDEPRVRADRLEGQRHVLSRYPEKEMRQRGEAFLAKMARRRSVRRFSSEAVSRDIVETAIQAAGSAPSGANKQAWRFVIVDDLGLKEEIRAAAEREERALYQRRASTEWLADLAPLGTSWQKPFLVEAPYLIVVFALAYGLKEDGSRSKNYYVNESVGIAVGLLLAALQEVGLASLTYTPSPMGFLKTILSRPANERPFMVIPVGYPASDATVPDLARKDLSEILVSNVAGAEIFS